MDDHDKQLNKDKKNILLIQSLVRIWLAARVAEKRIKLHVLRTRIAHELLETELSYLRDIRTIYQEFQLGCGEVLNNEEQAVLFTNIKDIVSIRIELDTELSKQLQVRIKKWSYHQTVADVIQLQVIETGNPSLNINTQQLEKLQTYQHYVTNYQEAASFLKQHRTESPKFDKFLQARESNTYCRGLKFESFLIMPVQRLPRYILLLKELRKHTDPSHPDYIIINNVMKELDKLAKIFNEAQRDKETNQKIEQIMNLVLGAEQVVLETPFIYEGTITYKKIKRAKQGFVRSLSMKKSTSFVAEKWKDLYMYLGFLINATKTLIGALHGKGYYKFSKTRAHTLKSATLIEVTLAYSLWFMNMRFMNSAQPLHKQEICGSTHFNIPLSHSNSGCSKCDYCIQ